MDALEYMFSVAREDSSNVLEFKPECIMREDLMSLSSKFPLIPGSQRSITFCTTPLSQKLRETPADADFDLTDPYNPPPRYNVLHDPHLKEYFQNPAMRRRLGEKGFITNSGFIKCTLLEFNMFRQWIRKLKLDRIHQERRRQRRIELQLWKERQAREQLLRDEELYSIVRLREQKARELKERGAKRREADRKKYLKLQEIDRKRRDKFEEDIKRRKDMNESEREKYLTTKQVEKSQEEDQVKKIKIRLLVKRNSEDKHREKLLQKRRQTIIAEKEQRVRENWKRRCSLSLARQEEKRKQEEEDRLAHERNVARRTSIVEQQRRKSRVHHDLCLQKRRSTLEKQHQEAENFLEKMREKKMRDLERWKQKHARMREKHQQQGRRVSLQNKASNQDQKERRRSRLSSVWDLKSSLRKEFGIEDNVVYSGVVFAGRKTKHKPGEGDQLETVAEEATYRKTGESDNFEKLWSRLEAEFALRERVHYVVFGIISNAAEVLDRQERQETYSKIPNYVQGIVNAAQEILANDQLDDVRSKVRNYILQVIDDASLAVDDSGLLLSSDAETRRKAQEVVTNAINRAREDVISLRLTAKEVVATATGRAVQAISDDLFECAKDIVAAAVISAMRYVKDTHEVIAARSLAVEAVNAARASLERLYGAEFELVVEDKQLSTGLDKCAKELTTAAIVSATSSLERVLRKDDCDLIAARSLASDAVAAAKASLEKLYNVNVELEDEDQDHYVTISKCLVKSAKDIAQAMASPPEKSLAQDDLEGLTAQKLATDAILAAKASLEKLGISVQDKDDNERAAKDIAAAAVMSAARSLQKDFLANDRDLLAAARGVAGTALDSARESLDWFCSTKVVPHAKVEGQTHKLLVDLDEVARDIAEVAVDSATQSLEQIMEKNEWDLISTTRDLVSDVIDSAKASLERLYGVKIEPEEELILTLQQASESSLEYSIFSTSDSMESLTGHEYDLWIAAQSLAMDALKSAKASLQRLNNIADQMEDNIKQTALDISKTLMDSSGNLLQKLEREGLAIASRDLGCSAIESAAKSFSKLHEDETSLQKIAGSDSGLLNAAAKVSTVSARASLGELFDRGFIGGQELEEATGYLATHAMLSAENLLDTLEGDTAVGNLDLEICKVANELASNAVVSAERSIARLVGEQQQTSIDRDIHLGSLFWKVTTYVEGLINGALRHLGAEGYFVHISDNSEEYEILTRDEACLADMEYRTHEEDIYQREILALRASRIVIEVVQNAVDIAKTRMANKSFISSQSVADAKPRTRRRSSSVQFNETSIFRSRRDSYVPRETDFFSAAKRPPTPRFRKDRAGSVASQAVQELENELVFLSDSDEATTNTSDSGLVRRRSSDPGPDGVASPRPERSLSDSNINEQSNSLKKKVSLYDIIKKREETASCEISPCESYVVLPQLNPSERSLIAARVESYEVLWKQKTATPSVTSLPSLTPKSSFVASEAAEQVNSSKQTTTRSVSSSSRLPDIRNSTSKIYSTSSNASSLKDISAHPKRTSSQKLTKSSKASPRTSRESVKVLPKPSTEKTLQSPRASVGKVSVPVSSHSSLYKKEGSRRGSGENVAVASTKTSVKDGFHLQRTSVAKGSHSPGGSLTKATLSPRTSAEKAVLSKGKSSKTQIKSSPQNSKLSARVSTEKTTSSSGLSLQKGPASSRGSMERAALTPRESTQKGTLSTRVSSQKVASSPSTSKQSLVLSSAVSKGNIALSARASTGNATFSRRGSKGKVTPSPTASIENATLPSRSSKGNVTQSPRASTENAALLSRLSKEKITKSSCDSSENVALLYRGSKGKVTQSPRVSEEKIALSSRVSKEDVQVSPLISTEKATPSSESTEKVQFTASVSKAGSALSSNNVKTSSNQSAKRSDSQEAVMITEPIEKTPSLSGGKLSEDLVRSSEKLGKEVDLDGVSPPVEYVEPKSDVVQIIGEESMETKNVEISKTSKKGVRSLERLIQQKRLTPEGAEADPRPASSADMTTMRKYTDPTAAQRTFTAPSDSSKSTKSFLTLPPSTSVSPKSSLEKVLLKESERKEVVVEGEGEGKSDLQGVYIAPGDKSSSNGDKKGSINKVAHAKMEEKLVERFSANETVRDDFEGYPTFRKVSVSRSIHDTVDDIVQKMLDTTGEPTTDLTHSHALGSGSLKEFRRGSEKNLEAPRLRKERLPTDKVSRTVIEALDFMVQSVSSSDDRRSGQSSGRQFSGGVPRATSSREKFSRGSTPAQAITCVYGISPSPPKLPSPKRSRVIAALSQDSMGIRATQSDSSIVSSSSDKAADLRPKVSGAWVDDVIVASGETSVRSQSPLRPSSSPAPSQHRRSSQGRLSVKNSLDGVCLERNNSVEKAI